MSVLAALQSPLWRRFTRIVSRVLLYTLIVIGGIMFAIPFIWMVRSSIMPARQIYRFPPEWIPEEIDLSHYVTAFEPTYQGSYWGWMRNSFMLSSLTALGAVLSQAGHPQRAERALRKALALNGRRAVCHFNLLCLLLLQGRWDEAVPHLDRYLELRPADLAELLHLANALHEAGRGDAALKVATRASTAFGASPRPFVLGGSLLATIDRVELSL